MIDKHVLSSSFSVTLEFFIVDPFYITFGVVVCLKGLKYNYLNIIILLFREVVISCRRETACMVRLCVSQPLFCGMMKRMI